MVAKKDDTVIDDTKPSLLADERRALIVQTLSESGASRVADLAERLDVTPVTIRRDLNLLQERGMVVRVHGGVALKKGNATFEGTDHSPEELPPVGMVVPSLDYYWPSVARGAEERAATRGMRLILRKSAYWSIEEDRIQVEHLVEQVGVKGLLLTINVSEPGAGDLLQWIADRGVPTVLVERQGFYPNTGQPAESVISDHRAGTVVAIKHLLDLNHERIGFVIGRDSPTGQQIKGSWSDAAAKFGIDPEPAFSAELDNRDPQKLESQVGDVFKQYLAAQATALVVHADVEANALVQYFQSQGLNVPGDLSVVAYDDEVASMFTPALTAVRPPRLSIGESAVDLLAGRMADPFRPAHRLILSPRLSVRESTAPPGSK